MITKMRNGPVGDILPRVFTCSPMSGSSFKKQDKEHQRRGQQGHGDHLDEHGNGDEGRAGDEDHGARRSEEAEVDHVEPGRFLDALY